MAGTSSASAPPFKTMAARTQSRRVTPFMEPSARPFNPPDTNERLNPIHFIHLRQHDGGRRSHAEWWASFGTGRFQVIGDEGFHHGL